MRLALLLAGAAVALTSCSQLPSPAATAVDTAPVDPSVASASASAPASDPATATADSPGTTPSPAAPSASAAAARAVSPFITAAEWDASAKALDVSAIVPGVTESGGTCTTTATLGSADRSAASTGVAASSYTGCPGVTLQGLASGTWQVRVRYSSPTSEGQSASRTVRVP